MKRKAGTQVRDEEGYREMFRRNGSRVCWLTQPITQTVKGKIKRYRSFGRGGEMKLKRKKAERENRNVC